MNLLLLVLLGLLLQDAPPTLRQEASIEGNFDAFTTDELGNIYALKGDELQLFLPSGRSWLRNSLKTFGRITTMDAFYSLKPMVFAQEQGQLAVLDNTLSVQGSVMNLPRLGYPQVTLACMSVQNHFWFYDQRDMALVRVDAQIRQVASSGRLDQLLGYSVQPLQMQEFDNWLYVNDPGRGILVFDLFAAYYKTIPIKGARSFEVRQGALYHYQRDTLFRYDMRTFQDDPLPVPQGVTPLDMRMESGRLFVRTKDRILVYTADKAP